MGNVLTLLNEDMQNKICTSVLEGKSYREIMEEIGVKESTFYNWIWNDYRGLRTRLNEVKKEIIIRETEEFSKELRKMDTLNEKGRQDPKLLAIKQKEAEFLRETLGKDVGYTKRVENVNANFNKTEPLDTEQQARIDKLLNTSNDNVAQ